jgi:hypothetical protein
MASQPRPPNTLLLPLACALHKHVPAVELHTPLPAHAPRPGMGDGHGGAAEQEVCRRNGKLPAGGPTLPGFHTVTAVHGDPGVVALLVLLHCMAHWLAHTVLGDD